MMTGLRVIPPAEAARWLADPEHVPHASISVYDAVHTIVVQAKQLAAVHARHRPVTEDGEQWCADDGFGWPCPTAQDVGVTA